MKKIEVILKVTDSCNLRCSYCYNSEREYKRNCVSLERFEKLLSILLTDYNYVHVIWHGGEPLCAGIDFFKQAIDAERKTELRHGVRIENSIQTNGTLINDKWIKFFKQNDFRVGISFDGVDNSKHRQQTQKTLDAMRNLKKAGVGFSCLAVVADNDYNLKANYRFFAENHISFDFSRLFTEGAAKCLSAPKAEKYAADLIDLFDEWLYDTDGVGVRTFAYYINMAVGGKSRICTCCSCHAKYVCLTPDGTLYNCGREGLSAYPFGNIDDIQSVSQMFSSEGARKLLKGSVERRNKCKESCEYFDLCRGGCADNAVMENGLENIPRDYCYIFKTVYGHISEKMTDILNRQVPLSELNPTVKFVLGKALTKMGGTMETEIADSYI